MLLIIGGALWAVAGMVGGLDGGDRFYLAESIWLAAQLALLAGTVDLWRVRPHGQSRVGDAGFALAAVGRVLFVIAELLALATGEVQEAILPAAVLASALGMLIAGIAVVGTGCFEQWARWTPLLVGAYPFVLMFPFVVTAGEPPVAALVGWGVAFAALGAAAASYGRTSSAPLPG